MKIIHIVGPRPNYVIPAIKPFIEDLIKQGFRLSKNVAERALKEAGE